MRSNQLREGPDAKLLGATEATRPVVAAVSIDDAVEGLPRQKYPCGQFKNIIGVRQLG